MAKHVTVIIVAVLVCILSIYVAGYFVRGSLSRDASGRFRTYGTTVECRLFQPLGWIEAKISGIPVDLIPEVDTGNRTREPGW